MSGGGIGWERRRWGRMGGRGEEEEGGEGEWRIVGEEKREEVMGWEGRSGG